MSVNNTPSQLRHRSSTSSSPPQSRPVFELTPRSKIQALLASIDDDDDDSDKENQLFPAQSAAPNTSTTFKASTKPAISGTSKVDTTGSEDEDTVRPRKRRMIDTLQAVAQHRSAEEEDAETVPNAYERVRQRLLGKVASGPEDAEKKDASDSDSSLENISDRLKASAEARTGAQATPQQHRHSPDLFVSPATHHTSRNDSPGLFVSPDKRSVSIQGENLDSDAFSSGNAQSSNMNRLKALVERKRKERMQKEEATKKEKSSDNSKKGRKKQDRGSRNVTITPESENDDSDREAERRLTQQARPTRKANKKALEEMHRETQRMDRNRQLAYEAKTKTKFTTESLFEKFNFRQSSMVPAAIPAVEHNSSSSVRGQDSDGEQHRAPETPPSSPPSISSDVAKSAPSGSIAALHTLAQIRGVDSGSSSDDLEDVSTMLARHKEEKNRSKSSPPKAQTTKGPKIVSLRKFAKSVKPAARNITDSDDDLEIVPPTKPSRLAIFDQIPTVQAQDSYPLRALRALAHVNDGERAGKKAQKSMTAPERDQLLRAKAREQARLEREEKIQRLKEKGVILLSAEEKEQEQLQIEDMLEKARREAGELAKREKELARKGGNDGDGTNQLLDSDDSDAEWNGEDGDDEAGSAQLSGSDDEEAEADNKVSSSDEDANGEEEGSASESGEDLDDEVTATNTNPFVDGEAAEHSDDSEALPASQPVNPRTSPLPKQPRHRKKVVISDDEDQEDSSKQLIHSETDRRMAKPSLSDAFGFAPTTNVLPGLSQVFGGTMADSPADAFGFATKHSAAPNLADVFANTMGEAASQGPSDTLPMDDEQFSMAFLRGLPPPTLPDFVDSVGNDTQSVVVRDSQANDSQAKDSQPGLVSFETQSQFPPTETQLSQMPDPSQDVGFQLQPLATILDAVPASFETIATVLLPREEEAESPVKRPRRLVRASEVDRPLEGDGDDEIVSDSTTEQAGNAFDIMRDAAKRPLAAQIFNKKRSEAKDMVVEQAEESEDEYAGLGGASDDESNNGELDEETRKMIDDEGKEKVIEADIAAYAAYYANKERADDEKQVERLYRDIANGGLRRKRGADLDLFDSDDEDEAAARRRAAKQREFARMRKALLADEKLGKLAQNPKQQAFLQAIEDHDDDYDLGIFIPEEESTSQNPPWTIEAATESQDQQQPAAAPPPPRPLLPSTIVSGQAPTSDILANTGRKRRHSQFAQDNKRDSIIPPVPAFGSDASQNAKPNPRRAPPNITRITRPTSLLQVRSTISELIGEPDHIAGTDCYDFSASPEPESEPEAEEQDDEPLLGQRHEDHNPIVNMHIDERDDDLDIYANDKQTNTNLSSTTTTDMPPPPPPVTRRPKPAPTSASISRTTVIDRMATKKRSSLPNLTDLPPTTTTTTRNRLAFQASSTGPTTFNGGFRKPSLLRRATTASSTGSSGSGSGTGSGISSVTNNTNNNHNSAATGTGAGYGKETLRAGSGGGGATRSSVNWYSREEERRGKMERGAGGGHGSGGKRVGKEWEEREVAAGVRRRGLAQLGIGLGAGAGGGFD